MGEVIVGFGVCCEDFFFIIKIWVDNYVKGKFVVSFEDSFVKL